MALPPISEIALARPESPAVVSETEAIALRIYPFSNTSHIVIWIAENGRRLVTSVKGANRPKSAFLGQYDLFYKCDILYYGRSSSGVYPLRECEALERHDSLRANWRAEHCASWFSALVDLASNTDTATPALYRLFDESLNVLSTLTEPPPAALLARFEAKLLLEAGLRPNFSGASDCQISMFSIADGCIASSTSNGEDDPEQHRPSIPLSPQTIALYDIFADSQSIGPGSSILHTNHPALPALLRFLGLFIHYHLPDAPSTGRATALSATQAEHR